ncbi:hypothetical protein LIER_30318 [Lithospermum erythrorhizon]|uniref:Uncharacterized protein n=1 Tax=Lithospermum erythrorhizon TaxID=34254 RepID=A0AAV3RMA6_LITER
MSPVPSPDKATHDALHPFLDQVVLQRVTRLAPGPPMRPHGFCCRYSLNFPPESLSIFFFFMSISDSLFFPFFQTVSASRALADVNSILY